MQSQFIACYETPNMRLYKIIDVTTPENSRTTPLEAANAAASAIARLNGYALLNLKPRRREVITVL